MPCGRVMGHGEYCSEGYLCDACIKAKKDKKLITVYKKALEIIADIDKIDDWMVKKGMKKRKGFGFDPDGVNESLVTAMGKIAKEALGK